MRRRDFIALLGGGVIALGVDAAIFWRLSVPGISIQANFLRLVMRWFIKHHDNPKPDLATLRSSLRSMEWIIPSPPRGTKEIMLDANGLAVLRVSRPESRDGHYVFYLHGGGYVFGSLSLYRDFFWRIAATTQAHVICVDYRLAPEHPFPAAVNDSVNAYLWLLAGGADPKRIVIIGDSAGGGLAFATLLRLRDSGVRLPAAAVAISPWIDLTMTGESLRRNAAADPLLNPEQARSAAGAYLAGADSRNPYASPLYGDLTGLPPTLIQVGSDEIMLDDAARMADSMRTAGGTVDLQVWHRMPHVWPLFARLLPEGRRAVEQIGAFVRKTFASAG